MNIDQFIFSRKVHLSPFRGSIMVAVNMDEYRAMAKHMGMPVDMGADVHEAFVQHQVNTIDGNMRGIIMVNPLKGDMSSPNYAVHFTGVLVHEIQHIVTRLQEVYGYTAPNENEPVSYLIEHLYKEISSIVFNATNIYLAGYNYFTSRMANEIHWMPERYVSQQNNMPESVVSSALINYYHATHNHQVYAVQNGYSATTYWW